ncbi:MAG: class IV adenylate cyclase [Candidatus Omnitrophica bacterium]|nr:class IV adenylate cyclase [Candidatus Omnitrophota bacterium]
MLEIEAKFKITDEKAILRALKRIGARFKGRVEEKDIYYKAPTCCKKASAVRLRSAGKRNIFTVKRIPKKTFSRNFKIRDEFETDIENKKAFQEILKILKFNPAFRKEKRRLLYEWRRLKISVDKLPFIGVYLEIEGDRKRIRKAAKALGLDKKNAITSTYMELFDRYKKLNKKPGLELVFRRKKSRG